MKKVFGGAGKSLTQSMYANPIDDNAQLGYLIPEEWTASSDATNVLNSTSIRCAAKVLTQRI